MHNNAAFLSRLSSYAYEFDKREVRFHLRKSVATRKKIIMVNGTFINQSIIYYWAACAPSHKMGLRSSVSKSGLPGEGRHEGLIPRNDVLTNGFI